MIGFTFSDIVAKYLSNKNKPKHISVILNHLNNSGYNTYERSLIRSLQLELKKRFVFYNDGYIGLVSKRYTNEYTIKDNPKLLSWDENFIKLKTYKETHFNKLPSITNGDKDEKKLKTFYNSNKCTFRKGLLDDKKLNLFKSIGIIFTK